MSIGKRRALTEADYEAAAQEYLHRLPLQHFMEAYGQSHQREITLESLALVAARRPEVRVFNEMLVQYPVAGRRRLGQVVPDNMVVLSDKPLQANRSFNTQLEPAAPFWMLEYVSNSNKRKDYEDNFDKYERDLKARYYLLFYPDGQELALYRHNGKKYVSVKPNRHGRYAVRELDMEVALHEGWVRFWYEGELLPLPAELQQSLTEARRHVAEQTQRADDEKKRADDLQRRLAEAERQLEQLRRAGVPVTRRNHGKPEAPG